MSNCYEDACGNCGTVGLRIPNEMGKWAFDDGTTICRDENGVIAHPN